MTKTAQTNTPDSCENPPKRRRGGQPGNRNAARADTALSTRIRDLKKRLRAALKNAGQS